MGAKAPHKKPKPPSAYVCKIDPKGYFGENAHSSCKEGVSKNQKEVKKASPKNNPIKEKENEDSLLPPPNFRPKASFILV